MLYEKIRVTQDGDVAVIAFSDPATLNACGLDTAAELSHAFAEAGRSARAIVLTGDGRGFCSGANLTATGQRAADPGAVDMGSGLETVYHPFILQLRDLPIPFVTAVNGPAAGIGCSIALMGDIIVAAESAYFLQAFRRIGLVPDGGSTYLLARMIGRARAMEMMLLGEKIPAKQALEWGMINRCVADADLLPTAMTIAQELAKGPKALGLIRKIAWAALDNPMPRQLDVERETQAQAGRTADFLEGVSAFLQKRPAEFKGA